MSIDIVFAILLSYFNRCSVVQRAENEPPVYVTCSRKSLAKAPCNRERLKAFFFRTYTNDDDPNNNSKLKPIFI